jgi:hypothetical protein
LLIRLTSNSQKFDDTLIRNVFFWSMSELIMDIGYFVWCIIIYKRLYF